MGRNHSDGTSDSAYVGSMFLGIGIGIIVGAVLSGNWASLTTGFGVVVILFGAHVDGG